MPVITLIREDMIHRIIANWLDQGLINSEQADPARELLGDYPVGALAGILLESHTSKLENMLRYEAEPSPDRRN